MGLSLFAGDSVAMLDWPPEDMRHTGRTQQEHMLAAIAADDHRMFYAALPAVADDLNKNKGQYLRAAAEVRNMLFMKELTLAGADIPYATAETERERNAIQKNTYWDDDIEDVVTKFKNPADEARYKTLSHTIATLNTFQQTYTQHIAPDEMLKTQQRILKELEELKRDVTELRDGKPLEKGLFAAPAALRPKTP